MWLKMTAWSIWKGLGWGAIIYLAAIAGIDQELYEAATIDGAGRWGQIIHITVPSLLPTYFVLLILSVANLINNGMDQYFVFQNSFNIDTIEVLDLYVYNIGLGKGSTVGIPFATVISMLKSLISVTLLFSVNGLSKLLRKESIV
jgi:ABC-type polysaccharide transport system permease subunit